MRAGSKRAVLSAVAKNRPRVAFAPGALPFPGQADAQQLQQLCQAASRPALSLQGLQVQAAWREAAQKQAQQLPG